MKVSYSWLKTYFESDIPRPEDVGHALGMHSFEIEEVAGEGAGAVIDADVLANRAHDCLCHLGIAKEIAAACNIPLAHDPLKRDISLIPESNSLEVSMKSDACVRYIGAVIKNVSVGPSPDWLRERLEVIGERSINNIVDATNYVMFSLGQPLHAFDMDKLTSEDGGVSIAVRFAREGEKMTTLGGDEYTLTKDMQLITDGGDDTPIALAGIKGGVKAEVVEKTKNLVIESAHFDPIVTRRTAQALKLFTHASKRYENEISPKLAEYGVAEAVALILEIAGGEFEGYAEEYTEREKSWQVSVSKAKINSHLGTNISDTEIEDIFTRLSFEYSRDGSEYTVTPPFTRLDIQIPEDLIEEVGRIYGYENIPEHEPERMEKEGINKRFYYSEKIRQLLQNCGFTEVCLYSLRDTGDLATENSLASDKSYLRAHLRDGIREALDKNERLLPLLGGEAVRIFEIGTVFPKEGEHFSLAIGARATGKKGELRAEALVRDAVKTLESGLGIPNIEAGSKNGILELNLSSLLESLENKEEYENLPVVRQAQYAPFSSYPFIARDIAVWTPEGTTAESVLEIIQENAKGKSDVELMRSDLFDEFSKDGRTSFAFRLVFQSKERTLTDEEVNSIMERVQKALQDRPDFEVR